MLEDGTYKAVVIEGDLGMTSTGKEQIAIQFHVPDMDERITWYGYFTDAAFEITAKAMRTCGWTGDDVTDLTMIEGTEVQIVVESEEYQGESKPKVRWVNPPGGVALKTRMSDKEKLSFAERMKAKMIKFQTANDCDDIPF